MLHFAIGHSEEPETKEAIEDVLAQCEQTLQGRKPQAGLLFASIGYDFAFLTEQIRRRYPGIQIAGCSSFGEISSKKKVAGNSVALLLLDSDAVEIHTAFAKEISQNEKAAVAGAIKEALPENHKLPSLCLLFADGLTSNITDVINGVAEGVGNPALVIGGGGACDDWKFQKVFVFHADQVASNAASMMLLSEPLKCSIAVRHGHTPFPFKTRSVITHSEKNILYTIDNMPALDFYKLHLGEHANYEAYALLIYLDDPERFPDRYLVRAPFRIDRENGSITFPGDIPQGCQVTISQLATKAKTLEAAQVCIKQAREAFKGDKIDLALVYSCALRKEILGTDTPKEIEIIQKELPDVDLFGFYTYGEIGHHHLGEPSRYYNETIVVILIGE
ncbi:MAG: FIST C-terminal domain-containing protein [Parachlamydia sp.]|nr:FIST C-terminal domain-containing protein [Parachlamydia sp.]